MPTDDERIHFLLENIIILSKGSERQSLESQLFSSTPVRDFLEDPR